MQLWCLHQRLLLNSLESRYLPVKIKDCLHGGSSITKAWLSDYPKSSLKYAFLLGRFSANRSCTHTLLVQKQAQRTPLSSSWTGFKATALVSFVGSQAVQHDRRKQNVFCFPPTCLQHCESREQTVGGLHPTWSPAYNS